APRRWRLPHSVASRQARAGAETITPTISGRSAPRPRRRWPGSPRSSRWLIPASAAISCWRRRCGARAASRCCSPESRPRWCATATRAIRSSRKCVRAGSRQEGVASIDFGRPNPFRGEKPMVETLAADVHPPYLYPDYKSTRLRAPAQPLVRVAPNPLEAGGPAFPRHFVKDSEADLTTWGKSAPLGEKMVLVGRVLDEDSRPVRRSLI